MKPLNFLLQQLTYYSFSEVKRDDKIIFNLKFLNNKNSNYYSHDL